MVSTSGGPPIVADQVQFDSSSNKKKSDGDR